MTRKPSGANIVILDDPHDVAHHAAAWLVEQRASLNEATVSVCLSFVKLAVSRISTPACGTRRNTS
jgi:hypothetical protein